MKKQSMTAVLGMPAGERLLKQALGAALGLALLSSTLPQAQAGGFQGQTYGHPNMFAGVDAMYWDIKGSAIGNESYNGAAARLRLGASLTPYFGLEAHAATGGNDSNGGLKHDFRNLTSALVRVSIPLSQDVNLYGLGGYTEVKARQSAADGSAANLTQQGGSYGVGLELPLFDNASGSVELMRYLGGSDYRVDTLSAGLTYRF